MNTNDKMLHDSAVSAQTPEGIEFILYPAGPLVRICALGIDTVLQWLLMIIGTLITDIWEGSGGWIMLLTGFALNWLYFTAWEIFYQGQTLGKRVMGIRVVQGNGSPVSPAASFIRNLLRFADTFFYLYAIGLMCAAASPGFRRIGDWAADTLVVYTARSLPPAVQPRRAWLQEFPLVSPPRPLSYPEKQAVIMFARRYPLLGQARADEIAGDFVTHLRGSSPEEGASRYLLGIARKIGGDLV